MKNLTTTAAVTERAVEIHQELRHQLTEKVGEWKLVGIAVMPSIKADSRLPIITELTFSHALLSPGLSDIEFGSNGEEAIWDWADELGLLDGETDVQIKIN